MNDEKKQGKNLPSIQELYKDTDLAIKENQLNALLNQEPPKSWIVQHPTIKKEVLDDKGNKIKVPIDYIPINRVEWLLTRIFLKWRVEVRKIQLIANSVQVTVRLHYKNPLDGELDWQDGIGAVPLQTDRDAGAIDFNKLKSNSVMMAAPAAETYAIKDAAHKIGNLFGKDLNRKDIENYTGSMQNASDKLEIMQLKQKLSSSLEKCKDKNLSNSILDQILVAEENGTNTIQLYIDLIEKLEVKNDNS